jgi:hypothetical protein
MERHDVSTRFPWTHRVDLKDLVIDSRLGSNAAERDATPKAGPGCVGRVTIKNTLGANTPRGPSWARLPR